LQSAETPADDDYPVTSISIIDIALQARRL